MAASRDRAQREARVRERVYRARRQHHDEQIRRRVRDNVVAGIGAAIVLLVLGGAQFAYYAAGPGGSTPSAPTPATTTDSIPGPLSSVAP